MRQVAGWWDWDGWKERLRNRVTGESLRYLRRATKEEVGFGFRSAQRSSGRAEPVAGWHRFQYEHSDLSYPLIVAADVRITDVVDKQVVEVHFPFVLESEPRARCRFVLDHALSWHVHRRESGRQEPAPPYGIFRRIDDCVPDGLLFWPPATVARGFDSKQGISVGVIGGWTNAQWRPDTRRIERTLAEGTLYSPSRGDVVDETAVLSDLEGFPPRPLQFVDPGALIDDCGAVHLRSLNVPSPEPMEGVFSSAATLEKAVAEQTVYLRDEVIETLFYCMSAEAVAPHQRSDSGRAVEVDLSSRRVPARRRGHAGFPKMLCAYVDPQAVSVVAVTGLTETWFRHLYGPVRLAVPCCSRPGLSVFGDETGRFHVPSFSLFRFLIYRHFDCFSAWEGVVADRSDWDEQLTLDACFGLYVHSAYRAGIYMSRWPDFLTVVDFGTRPEPGRLMY